MFGILSVLMARDNADVELLYKKYYKLLYSVISKNVNNTDDIEDCIQDTFKYFVKRYNTIEKNSQKEIKNYLATIANGLSINKYKENLKDLSAAHFDDEDDIAIQNATFSDSVFDNVETVEISMVIDKLNEKDKNFFYLSYIYGYNSKEIADMFNVKDSYVRKRLQISKEFLRKELIGDE